MIVDKSFYIADEIIDEILSFLRQDDICCHQQRYKNEFVLDVYRLYIKTLLEKALNKSNDKIDKKKREQLGSYYSKFEPMWIKIAGNIKKFDPCSLKCIANEYMECRLNSIIKSEDQNYFDAFFLLFINDLRLPICLEHDSCLKFISNYRILSKVISGEISITEAQKDILCFRQAERIDELIDLLFKMKEPQFNINEKYQKHGKKLVYLDTNVFIKVEEEYANEQEDDNLWTIIKESKSQFDYVYSPSHLEDIQKRKTADYLKKRILSIIDRITDTLFIHRVNDGVEIDSESFFSNNARASNSISSQITYVVEQHRIDMRKLLNIDYSDFNKESHIITINNKDLFGKDIEILKQVLRKMNSQLNLEEIYHVNICDLTYSDINSIIYDLVNAMDILHYNSDKIRAEKKIISSVHDIEHLIYASYSDFFVTDDSKLRNRAKVIFAHMIPSIMVMSSDDFKMYLRGENC